MKNTCKILLLYLVAAFMVQCGEGEQPGAVISGKLDGAANLQVHLDQLMPTNQINSMGTVTADAEGNFELPIENMIGGLYQFRIGQQASLLVLSGKEKDIQINGKITDFILTKLKPNLLPSIRVLLI